MTVAVPTRTSVHGRAPAMSSVTGVGYFVTEIPRSPRNMRPQYARYWFPERGVVATEQELDVAIVVSEISPPARCILADHDVGGVPRHETGKQEVERDRGPQRERVEPDSSCIELHVTLS